jgi:hypothetical protein
LQGSTELGASPSVPAFVQSSRLAGCAGIGSGHSLLLSNYTPNAISTARPAAPTIQVCK